MRNYDSTISSFMDAGFGVNHASGYGRQSGSPGQLYRPRFVILLSGQMNMRHILLIALAAPFVLSGQLASTTDFADQLSKRPTDHEPVRRLSGQYGPGVVEAFEKAFEAVEDPEDKALAAWNLMDDGITDQKYFDYLADRARTAIEDDAPLPFLYDSNGKEIKTHSILNSRVGVRSTA